MERGDNLHLKRQGQRKMEPTGLSSGKENSFHGVETLSRSATDGNRSAKTRVEEGPQALELEQVRIFGRDILTVIHSPAMANLPVILPRRQTMTTRQKQGEITGDRVPHPAGGTGSKVPSGTFFWQERMRLIVKTNPCLIPCTRTASIE